MTNYLFQVPDGRRKGRDNGRDSWSYRRNGGRVAGVRGFLGADRGSRKMRDEVTAPTGQRSPKRGTRLMDAPRMHWIIRQCMVKERKKFPRLNISSLNENPTRR